MRIRGGLSIRARLTGAYGTAFVLAGAGLLVVTLTLAERNLPVEPVTIELRDSDALAPADGGDQLVPAPRENVDAAVAATARAFREATLEELRFQGLIALAAIGLLGFLVAWILAGRALRPIDHIASTARRLSHDRLHERIALEGPDDEVKHLADTFDEMLERVESGVGTERRFVANASHELRTPLTVERTLLEVSAPMPLTRLLLLRKRCLSSWRTTPGLHDWWTRSCCSLAASGRCERQSPPIWPLS